MLDTTMEWNSINTEEEIPIYVTRNTEEEIPIYVTRKEEDAESMIERTYQNLKDNEKSQKATKFLPNHIKTFIHDSIKDYINTKSKRDNYYEGELYKSLKNRIVFLEEEVREKNIMINNLIKNTFQIKKQLVNNCQSEFDNSLHPQFVEVDTPDNSITTEEPVEKSEHSLKQQLSEIRNKKHNDFLNCKNTRVEDIINDCNDVNPTHKNDKSVLIIADSMLNAVKEKGELKKHKNVKIKYFSGARINDVKPKIKELVESKPKLIIIHLGTNDAPYEPSNVILDNLLSLKHEIEKLCPGSKIVLSSLTPRLDHGKANITIRHFNNHLKQLDIEIMDNNNITTRDLGKKGLHLSSKGKEKMSRNIINIVKKSSLN